MKLVKDGRSFHDALSATIKGGAQHVVTCEEVHSAMVMVPDVIVGRRLTFEDYTTVPDDQDYEIFDGALFEAPSRRPRHQVIVFQVACAVSQHCRERDLGDVIPDADLIVTDGNVYVSPDLMYFARERYQQIDPDELIRAIPDLVVEVVSPTGKAYDRVTKRRVYAHLGIQHYWVFDPQPGIVIEHVLQDDRIYSEEIHGPHAAFRPKLVPDFVLPPIGFFPNWDHFLIIGGW